MAHKRLLLVQRLLYDTGLAYSGMKCSSALERHRSRPIAAPRARLVIWSDPRLFPSVGTRRHLLLIQSA